MTAVFQTLCEALPVVTVLLALPALWQSPRLPAARVHALLLTCALLALAAPLSLHLLPKWRILPALTVVRPTPAVLPVPAASVAGPAHSPRAIHPLPAAAAIPFSPASYRPWFRGIAAVWLAGMLLGLGAMIRQVQARRRLIARSLVLEGNAAHTPERLRRWLGIRRAVQVRLHPGYDSPVTWGVLRPVILLPMESRHWPDSQRRIVLTHELGHIRRHDALGGWILQALLIVYWFHPLAWRLVRRTVIFRELACDDLVIRAGLDPGQYATCLGAALLRAQSPDSLPATMAAFAQPHPALQRIRNILDTGRERSALGFDGVVRASAPATLLAIGLSSLGFKISSEVQPVTARWIAPTPARPAFSVWKEVVAPVIAKVTAPEELMTRSPTAGQEPAAPAEIIAEPEPACPASPAPRPAFVASEPLPEDAKEPTDPPAAIHPPASPLRRLSPPRRVAAWNSTRRLSPVNPATGPDAGTISAGTLPARNGSKAPASSGAATVLTTGPVASPATEPVVTVSYGVTSRDAPGTATGVVRGVEPATTTATADLTRQEASFSYATASALTASATASPTPSSGELCLIDSPMGEHLALTYSAPSGSGSGGVKISHDGVTWFSAPSLLIEVGRIAQDDGTDQITVALRDPVDYSPYRYLQPPVGKRAKE